MRLRERILLRVRAAPRERGLPKVRAASSSEKRGFSFMRRRTIPDNVHPSASAASNSSGFSERAAHGSRWSVVPEVNTEIVGERASNAGVLMFSAVVFSVVFALVVSAFVASMGHLGVAGITSALVLATLATMSVHVAQHWERVVVLRLGKFNRVSGPGLFWTLPVAEHNTMRVDMRVRVTTFGAEETLTADLVPLDVNAVLFWHVWDAKAACTEVGDFTRTVELAAQTALRDAIGRGGAAEVAIRRQQLDRELKRALEDKVSPWGITILSVEVRDILLPKDLKRLCPWRPRPSSARRRASF